MRKARWLVVPACMILFSCPRVQPPAQEFGSLILALSTSGMAAKTILPPLDMDIAYYSVSGDGPGSATFSRPGVTGATVVEDSLISGAWMIAVDAFNADDYLIGTGSMGVAITAGQTTQKEVMVTPLTGTGRLDIVISWPTGKIANPIISGTLEAAGGAPQAIPFSLVAGADSTSYSYTSLDVGYYSLTLQLSDGTTDKWGAFEAVRILKDQTTEASFNLTAEDINTGGVSITINPDMENPITITFTGHTSQLPYGTDMSITANTSQNPVNTYRWYLNGELLNGQTDSSIVIGSGLPEGNYRLDLGVTKGNIISSNNIKFSILELPAEVISTNVTETGTGLDIYFYKGPQFDVYPSPIYTIWVEDTSGVFIQNLFVSNGIGTNEYPMSHNWAARPMCAPYWAHKCCIEDPYAGDPTHDTTGMYLALPTGAGGPPPYPEGPIPSDLDAVTSATRLVDFHLQTACKNDGVSQFRVLMEIQKAWDYNTYYNQVSYNLPGQPSLIYGTTVDTGSDQRFYAMTLLGAGHPFGSDGGLYGTSNVTTALDILEKVIVHVR